VILGLIAVYKMPMAAAIGELVRFALDATWAGDRPFDRKRGRINET
jgi:hypothetical protein